MFESYSHYRLFFRVLLYIAPWAVVGYFIDELAWTLLIGTWLLLGWHYRHLTKLAHWLWNERRLTPPHGRGSWEPIFNGIYRLQGKNRRRRAQLARLLARFREGAEALPDAALVLGADGEILWSNRLASVTLGVRWPQDAGTRVQNLLRHPKFVKFWRKSRFGDALKLESPVNPNRILEIRVISYGDDQRLLIARDVTRVSQLEQMRRDFVANVSHELKTPLTVLQGYIEMMQMTSDKDSVTGRQYQAMEEQAHRMKNLVDRLLTLSKIESSPDLDMKHEVDMSAIFSTIKQEAEALAADTHQLTFDVDYDLDVYGDEMKLHSACANLVQNAIRYSPDGGEIKVSWRRTQNGARFEVRDQGEGIAEEHLPRLTERFYRVDKARSRDTGGTGLGLAIVKHALNHHNAHLRIESVPDVGSRFYFDIPESMVVSKVVSIESVS